MTTELNENGKKVQAELEKAGLSLRNAGLSAQGMVDLGLIDRTEPVTADELKSVIENRENADGIWDDARVVAKEQLGEAAISGMPPDFPSLNPYEKDDWRHDEWESAHEHYIMTGLGY